MILQRNLEVKITLESGENGLGITLDRGDEEICSGTISFLMPWEYFLLHKQIQQRQICFSNSVYVSMSFFFFSFLSVFHQKVFQNKSSYIILGMIRARIILFCSYHKIAGNKIFILELLSELDTDPFLSVMQVLPIL